MSTAADKVFIVYSRSFGHDREPSYHIRKVYKRKSDATDFIVDYAQNDVKSSDQVRQSLSDEGYFEYISTDHAYRIMIVEAQLE